MDRFKATIDQFSDLGINCLIATIPLGAQNHDQMLQYSQGQLEYANSRNVKIIIRISSDIIDPNVCEHFKQFKLSISKPQSPETLESLDSKKQASPKKSGAKIPRMTSDAMLANNLIFNPPNNVTNVPEQIIPVPNMGEKACWDTINETVKAIITDHKFDGIIIDIDKLYPLPYKRDYSDLRRTNKFGEHIHSLETRLKGSVVLQNPTPLSSSQMGSQQSALLTYIQRIAPTGRDILLISDLNQIQHTDDQNLARINSVVKSSFIPKVNFPSIMPRYEYHNLTGLRIVKHHLAIEQKLHQTGTILAKTGSGLDQVEFNGLIGPHYDVIATLLYLLRDPTIRFSSELSDFLKKLYGNQGETAVLANDGPLREFYQKYVSFNTG